LVVITSAPCSFTGAPFKPASGLSGDFDFFVITSALAREGSAVVLRLKMSFDSERSEELSSRAKRGNPIATTNLGLSGGVICHHEHALRARDLQS